jgi:hypothetical protein
MSDDELRTVVAAPGGVGTQLPAGHRVQEFVIEGLVGEGGFSIVYRAHDTQLGRTIALKEYMPTALASRGPGVTVMPRSERQRETFELGLRSFVNEARLLASFDHPSLVKVYRFWEDNGTAYMVMPLYQGPTLRTWLAQQPQPPDEAWLRALLEPLLDALEVIHAGHCYHRDIAPDNVLLLHDGAQGSAIGQQPRPVLLDFGAARRVIGDATQALTVILKPGFAPIEQYAESQSMRQGPWTDIYALCAMLYAAVTGHVPAPSVTRVMHDELVPAREAAATRYSEAFLEAIDQGMAVRPEQRPQSVQELRTLFAQSPASMASSAAGWAFDPDRTVIGTPACLASPPAVQASVAAAPLPMERAVASGRVHAAGLPQASLGRATPRAVASASTRPYLFIGAAAAAVVLAALGWWQFVGSADLPPGPGNAASGTRIAEPVPRETAVAPPTPTTPAGMPSHPVPAAEPTPAPPVLAAAAPLGEPFSVLAALREILAGADPALSVQATADKSTLVIDRDRLRFRVQSSVSGHLYVFTGGTDKSHFYLLFPNKLDRNNRIEAERELVIPRPGWHMTASGPPGTNQVVFMVSRSPRDMGGTGLKTAGLSIPEFDLGLAKTRWEQRAATGVSPFIGASDCRGAVPCPDGYGAQIIEVEEVER